MSYDLRRAAVASLREALVDAYRLKALTSTQVNLIYDCLDGMEQEEADQDAWTEFRERLGRAVREEWIRWAREQTDPKPSWLEPWEALTEEMKEVDRRIGERLFGGRV